MIMIGGAGVISGAIAGGFILGMMESIGLTVLAAYGDAYLPGWIRHLMIFLPSGRRGLMGKPWGCADVDRSNASHGPEPYPSTLRSSSAFSGLSSWAFSSCSVFIALTGRWDFYYTLTSVALLSVAAAGVWLTFYIGRINIGQGAYAPTGAMFRDPDRRQYGVSFWLTRLWQASSARLSRC